MMRKGLASFLALAAVTLAFGGCASQASDFCAEMVSKSGRNSTSGKVYVSGDKIRVEMQEAISISRPDKNLVWVVMPSEKMYMEQPIDYKTLASSSARIEGEIERKPLGQEALDGKPAQKFQVTYVYKGRKDTIYQWFIPDLAVPVKSAAVNGSWSVEYRNIRIGKQAPHLFELPAGYSKFSTAMPSMKDVAGKAMEDLF